MREGKEIKVRRLEDYVEKIEKDLVVIDEERRKEIIQKDENNIELD